MALETMPAANASVLFEVDTPGVSRRTLADFAGRLAIEVAGGGTFTCLLTSDRALRRLNREFRKQDHATDVLSFPAGVGVPDAGRFLGDIAISYEKARRQAAGYGHSIQREIEILMLHGVLHLLGMDHETDRGQMARAETKWRTALGLPCGLIGRAIGS